jgi:uncharacterized protein YdhG (YjbR/CyaY superfamily)
VSSKQPAFTTVDEYIATFPDDVQAVLAQVRATIRAAAPDAVETISYQMPTFKQQGKAVIYFAGYKKHIGIYPVPAGDAALQAEVAPYVAGKGTLQFPLEQPIPYGLIARVVKARVRENKEWAAVKGKKQV